jgi:hypothetical protein
MSPSPPWSCKANETPSAPHPANKHRQVITVPGDHSLKTALPAVATAIQTWLVHLLANERKGLTPRLKFDQLPWDQSRR